MLDEVIESANVHGSSLLTQEAMVFLERLHRHFHQDLQQLDEQQHRTNNRQMTKAQIKNANWEVKPVRKDLQDRRIVLKNSATNLETVLDSRQPGPNLFIADYSYESFSLNDRLIAQELVKMFLHQNFFHTVPKPMAVMITPSDWRKSDDINGLCLSACLVDVGLYLFHHTETLVRNGSAPYLCLKGLATYEEARWWNSVISYLEREQNLKEGTIKASISITGKNVHQLEGMLYALRDHCAGIHLVEEGRGISDVARYVISIGHKRKTHVIRENLASETNSKSALFEQGTREAVEGFDGKCVTDANLIKMMKGIWNHYMPEPNQIWKRRQEYLSLVNESTVV